ncbi:MAG TPA: UDP-glucose 4-epimerase GalE [Vicinamibacteria bacterium]|nr:UDP-glucose 4-epimerase GalE [Vicinamibacteria bacterium]
MKVLVTGGAGYIGSHAVRELLEADHAVTVLDDLSRGHRAALPPGVPLVEGDLGDASALAEALAGAEAVMHFAGLLSVAESVADPAPYYRTNVAKGLELLAAMRAGSVDRIIFSSTCATYGVPLRVPIDESHPQDPISPYGATKRAFERALVDHARAGHLRALVLRYFNAAGCHPDGSLGEDHRPEEHIVPRAIDAALGRAPALTIYGDDYDTPDGTCIRDYVHVQDLARAHVLALDAVDHPVTPETRYQAYNLGSETGHSVREVISAVERAAGTKVPTRVGARRPGDPPRLVASAQLARERLGWRPREAGLEPIVETALRWRREHPRGYDGP